jgi:Ring finger domain
MMDEVSVCSICIDNFKINEKIRALECCHSFHEICLTEWISRHASVFPCPLCMALYPVPYSRDSTVIFDATVDIPERSLSLPEINEGEDRIRMCCYLGIFFMAGAGLFSYVPR